MAILCGSSGGSHNLYQMMRKVHARRADYWSGGRSSAALARRSAFSRFSCSS
jgi:hypothetical protein